jgi:hypothetical protein
MSRRGAVAAALVVLVKQQDLRPQHPRVGYDELEKVLATFGTRGFGVTDQRR